MQKLTKDDLKELMPYKGKQVIACIQKVSKSGMTRKIDFFLINNGKYWPSDSLININNWIEQVAGYSVDKNGCVIVSGCGMDIIFSVLSNFNYAISEIIDGKRTDNYSSYFFDANHYQKI